MKITLRLPSKAVQYGYVEVEGSAEEFGFEGAEAVTLGQLYQRWVREFQTGEKGQGTSTTPSKAPQKPSAPLLEELFQDPPQRPVQSRTEVSVADDPNSLLADNEPATVSDTSGAPWVVKSDQPVSPKPWETKAAIPNLFG